MENDDLVQEYFHVQKVIEDFDAKMLTIKAWSVTFSAAIIGLAFEKGSWKALIVSLVSAISFWIVEALAKVNQQAYYGRIKNLESCFAGECELKPCQIGRSWSSSFHGNGRYWRAFRIMLWPHVFMPHAVIAILALLPLLFDRSLK